VVSFTPRPLYLQGKNPWGMLDRSLGGSQSWTERRGKENKLQTPNLVIGNNLSPFHPLVPSYTSHLIIVLHSSEWAFSKMFPHQNSMCIHCFPRSNLLPIPLRLRSRAVFWGLDRGLIGIHFCGILCFESFTRYCLLLRNPKVDHCVQKLKLFDPN
jgi:hypothetical protein